MILPPHKRSPRVFAHRGTALLAPENTLAAFDFALLHKSDVLETDVRLSRDGVVMVTHDETLKRTTDGTGRVRDSTLSQLKKLDAGCQFRGLDNHRYEGDRLELLTLIELFERYPNVGINIDIKDNTLDAATAVAKVIEQHSPTAWVNVGSFHAKVTQQFRECAPDISTAATRQEVTRLVFGKTPSTTLPYQLLQIPTSYWGIQLNRKPFIKKVHDAGAEIIFWTINDAKQMRSLLNKGADGVVTDRADIAHSLLSR